MVQNHPSSDRLFGTNRRSATRGSRPFSASLLRGKPNDDAERQAIRMAQVSIDGYGDADSIAVATSGAPSDDAELASLAAAMELLGSLGDEASRDGEAHDVAPLRIGRYEVMGECGRGGFGIVLHAFDVLLQRDVALKIPKPERLLAGQSLDELVREARMVAKLSHPGIVHVYEVRRWGPVWYIASDYCDGPTLREWLEAGAGDQSLPTKLEIVAATADAVHYAHARGVLHLDLKPENILLEIGPQGGTPRPMVTDFGLSHGDETKIDGNEKIGGTLTYMAPEQKARDGEQIGVATDVYALGVILAELIHGACAPRHVFSPAAQNEPTAWPSSAPKDLTAICRRCLAAEPSERYPSAQSLADDLRRYLHGEPVAARPLSWPRVAAFYCRRRPLASTMLIALVTTLVASYAVIVAAWRESNSHLASLTVAERRQRESAGRMEKSLLSLASFAQEAKLRTAYASDDAAAVFPDMKEFFLEARRWAETQPDGSAPTQGVQAAVKSMSLIDDLAEDDEQTNAGQFHAGVAAWLELMRREPEEERWRRALALHLFTYKLRVADGQWLSWNSSPAIADESVRRQLEIPYALLLIDYARARSRQLGASLRYGMLVSALEILSDERSACTLDDRQRTYWRITGHQQAAIAAKECWRSDDSVRHFAEAARLADAAPSPEQCDARLADSIAESLMDQWRRSKKPIHNDAIKRVQRAVTYGERAATSAPDNWHYLLTLVKQYRQLANAHRRQGKDDACLETLKAATAALDRGVARCGKIRQILSERAELQSLLANEYTRLDDAATARTLLEKATADFAAIELTSLDSRATWLAYGRALLSLTNVYAQDNRAQESCAAFERLVRVTAQMRGFTKHPQMQTFVQQARQTLAAVPR